MNPPILEQVISGVGIAVLIVAGAFVIYKIYSRLRGQQPKKLPLFHITIIGPRNYDYYPIETEDEIITQIHNGVEYKARKDQAYSLDYSFLEKLLNKRDREYSLIFYEARKDDKEAPQSVRPPDINTKVESKQFITANLLYRVWKYRGVKPAFRDEFKEPSQFNVPTWAIVIVVIVFVVVGAFIALQSGALDIAIEALKGGTVQ